MIWGSVGGSVDRAVASGTRDPSFESNHWRFFLIKHRFTDNCLERRKLIKKGPGIAHLNKMNEMTDGPSGLPKGSFRPA